MFEQKEVISNKNKTRVFIGVDTSNNKEVIVKCFKNCYGAQFGTDPRTSQLIPREEWVIRSVSELDLAPKLINTILNDDEYMLIMENLCIEWRQLFDEVMGVEELIGVNEGNLRIISWLLVTALQRMIDCGVYYVDIIPNHVWLRNGSAAVRFIDFSRAVYAEPPPSEDCGHIQISVEYRNLPRPSVREYTAPEFYDIIPDNGDLIPWSISSSMIYSLGCLIYFSLQKQTPPTNITSPQSISYPLPCSESFKDFVYCCVNYDPLLRPTFKSIQKHPWLLENMKFSN